MSTVIAWTARTWPASDQAAPRQDADDPDAWPYRAHWDDNELMLYMVIEQYLAGPGPVYQRAAESGRMLPDGLAYISSWVTADDMDGCFQLMETDDPSLFGAWTERWRDLVEFEIVPVITSAEAAARARGA